MSRVRRQRTAAAGLVALLVAGLWSAPTAAVAGAEQPAVGQPVGEVRYGRVANDLGTMTYRLFVPPQVAQSDDAVPLVVQLHGSNELVDDVAVRSRLDELALERGFVALYPQEDRGATLTGIWNWTEAAQQGRDGRAPSLVAATAEDVRDTLPIDPARITVGGFSAGAGMATVLAATHPDVFRGVEAEAGCMFNGTLCAIGSPDHLIGTTPDPIESARQAVAAMGEHARRQPFVISYGTLDPLALVVGQQALVEQWLATNDLVDDGLLNGSVPGTPATLTYETTNGRIDEVASYVDAQGCLLGERHVVHGLAHAYSGGEPLHLLDAGADPAGPQMREVAHDFFETQADGVCQAPPAGK
ncbi:alpha/beta hydrolase family esterase [Nocardioides sp. NPDC059952]|uniref:extracellular catalytic domain type 1 short-chain-length polyhydroxyalkanoate depolymerase n=1 Tax=Nocardioides sp. NPDC059952 TaxID=3347014 RepID=UPI0036696B2F